MFLREWKSMEVKFDSASPEDIAPIVNMKIEMFREFGYDQYLHEKLTFWLK